MDELALSFFPYPHVLDGQRRDGAKLKWPKRCIECRDRPCESTVSDEVQLCPYGLNFVHLDANMLVAGIVVRDYPRSTTARQKALRVAGREAVGSEDLNLVMQRFAQVKASAQAAVRAAETDVVEAFKASRDYETRVIELLRPEIQRAFGQIHDYRQFVSQIVQNINVILDRRYSMGQGGTDIETLLDRATHEEKAIYWAARLMEAKLEAALFLLNPNEIAGAGDKTPIRLHGLVTKHLRIYRRSFEAKDLKLYVDGESFGVIVGNDKAVGVIPHTFIDNAQKYAPRGSDIVVAFREDTESIHFTVSSFGPVIARAERTKIYELAYRGEAAQAVESEGMGMGLALAQLIAKQIGVEISFSQNAGRTMGDLVWTTFSARFSKD